VFHMADIGAGYERKSVSGLNSSASIATVDEDSDGLLQTYRLEGFAGVDFVAWDFVAVAASTGLGVRLRFEARRRMRQSQQLLGQAAPAAPDALVARLVQSNSLDRDMVALAVLAAPVQTARYAAAPDWSSRSPAGKESIQHSSVPQWMVSDTDSASPSARFLHRASCHRSPSAVAEEEPAGADTVPAAGTETALGRGATAAVDAAAAGTLGPAAWLESHAAGGKDSRTGTGQEACRGTAWMETATAVVAGNGDEKEEVASASRPQGAAAAAAAVRRYPTC
jgi:hypothetical protein